ncbi:hypothetical protein E3A20_15430 [Planctomyces bekefii]|uniref:Uncharacterized protein n=1 Tax=Planctomyces bekefii TaxID=1653850 RepID=A0A5C6M441_9PLAN|nr:hypothetical protein E3A20_15430 [Planctomyces bekefii]
MQMLDVMMNHSGLSGSRTHTIVEQSWVGRRRDHPRLRLPRGNFVQVVTGLSRVAGICHDRVLGSKAAASRAVRMGGLDLLILGPVVIDGHIDRRIVSTVGIDLESAERAGRVIALSCMLLTVLAVLAVLAVAVANSHSLNLSRSGGLLSHGRACKCQCSGDCKAGC